MTTSTDITNRALQMLGSRTTVASLAEQSNEAIQANLVYTPITDWAHATTNWNFARKVASLAIAKTVTVTQPWTISNPQPPWQFEYKLPADFIRAIYLTDGTLVNATTNYLGEPQRYVLATDSISAVQQQVLLTNVTSGNAVLVYTSRVVDPTLWPALFERFATAALAHALSFQLTGDKAVLDRMEAKMMSFFAIAEQQNRLEELMPSDATPEWIQAIGMDYPFRRRMADQRIGQQQEGQRDNRR